jgi:hypothetical protein
LSFINTETGFTARPVTTIAIRDHSQTADQAAPAVRTGP